MSHHISPRRFALLVGIDFYLNDGSRKSSNGIPIQHKNLRGCVNDIQKMGQYLNTTFESCQIRTLSSSESLSNPQNPMEPEAEWPTFENVKKELRLISQQAKAGDIFLFHFSGHGTRLRRTSKCPKGIEFNPSLLTMDYYCGNPAIRGWQLNKWLQKLHKKNIKIVAILDSCCAGGAWRSENAIRYQDLSQTPTLLIDKVATEEEASDEPNSRDTSLPHSWSINPKGFTLMAACKVNQEAEEKRFEGKIYGVFTYNLLKILGENSPNPSNYSYRTARDYVARKVDPQIPEVHGQDRLLFFTDIEPFSIIPLVTQIDGDDIIIPMGTAHGVHEKTDFMTTQSATKTVFSVHSVDTFHCKAKIPNELNHHGRGPIVNPSRWSLGNNGPTVHVSHNMGDMFSTLLLESLDKRIVGAFDIVESNVNDPDNEGFILLERHEAINIYAPRSLTGYQTLGPVRGLDLMSGTVEEQAKMSAIAISHLCRFNQILCLKDIASKLSQPFQARLEPNASGDTLLDGDRARLYIKNTGEEDLYILVASFGPGFHVKQIFPSSEHPRLLKPQMSLTPLSLTMKIPDKLRLNHQGYLHRDIIRVIVTNTNRYSFKSLELLHIWDIYAVGPVGSNKTGRDITLDKKAFETSWWAEDFTLFTRLRS